MRRQDVLKRAHAATRLPIRYKLGAGGRDPKADTPGDLCDCSGFVAWCFGIDRLTEDPFYLSISGGWMNTDAMVADGKSPRGFLDIVQPGDARPGDLIVFGKSSRRKYGHVGIVSQTLAGRPTKVIHCSAANSPTAVRETDPSVFVFNDAVTVRHKEMMNLPEPAHSQATIVWRGKMSTFGGPHDTGVSPTEGLALRAGGDVAHPRLGAVFLTHQPAGTSGLARRLNPDAYYIACRWDYGITSREFLRAITVKVQNPRNGRTLEAVPVDWGPNARTGRIADLSPGLASALGLVTDQECIVTVPVPESHTDPF